MNILIPDIWLRKFLKTKATPSQLKECLSLCGPSIERIYGEGKKTVYDIEVTGNRPDAMSVIGVAREATAILPRFGISAEILGDPYTQKAILPKGKSSRTLTLKTDPLLNPRWMSVVIDNVTVKASPTWLTQFLELAGMRSLNNVVDVTNYLMRAYGQPAHVFDYDRIIGHTMTLRASRKGEKLITLDGKSHTLPGDDIVIEDKTGKLVDLCGIMGGENSSVTQHTRRVMLFLQTYDASHIRKTSMTLAHRTEAASLFEKGIDTELVKPVFIQGVQLLCELTGGTVASKITDIYPKPYKKYSVSVTKAKVQSYIGNIRDKDISTTLTSLGFGVRVNTDAITVDVPSYRRDVQIDVDVIEEIARIYGYHNIPSKLPEGEPPVVIPDKGLSWEEEIKTRLRDWGYTEVITYSMISENLMDMFGLDKERAYKIANPLSEEWVYMRPHLTPSVLMALKQNIHNAEELKLFELGMTYEYRIHDLPFEKSTLVVTWTGNKYFEAKGLAEEIFKLFGIDFPVSKLDSKKSLAMYNDVYLNLGEYGSVGEINPKILYALGIDAPVTRLFIDFSKLAANAQPTKTYKPIPKYPPIVEDLSFVVPEKFQIGPLMSSLKATHHLVSDVTLLDVHEQTRTLHITYQNPEKNLTSEEIVPVRNKLIQVAQQKFAVSLKE